MYNPTTLHIPDQIKDAEMELYRVNDLISREWDGERTDSLMARKSQLEKKIKHLTESQMPVTDDSWIDVNSFLGAVANEYHRATQLHGKFNSAHEAYAIILEELDEFWDQVKLKKSERDPQNMKTELVQVAAMALRAAMDLGVVHE